MNNSRVSAIRIIQSLKKNWNDWKKSLKVYLEYGWLFVKETLEEMIRSIEIFFYFWG